MYLNTDNQCQFTVTVDFHSKPLLIDPEIFKAPLKFYRLTPDDELLEKKQVYNIQYILLNWLGPENLTVIIRKVATLGIELPGQPNEESDPVTAIINCSAEASQTTTTTQLDASCKDTCVAGYQWQAGMIAQDIDDICTAECTTTTTTASPSWTACKANSHRDTLTN